MANATAAGTNINNAGTHPFQTSGIATTFVGTCNLYTAFMNGFNCQNVIYSATGCLG